MTHRTLPSALLTTLVGALAGFTLGCVITSGTSQECGDPGTNSSVDPADGMCVCDAGYEFCSAADDDFTCCLPQGSCSDINSFEQDGLCYCDAGYSWCSDDPNDLSCCEGSGGTGSGGGGKDPTDGGSGGSGGSGGTGGGGCTMGVEPDPNECTAMNEGLSWCTHSQTDGPECSKVYICQGGTWIDDTATAEASCQADGYDFAYGCIDDGMAVKYVCGNGSGAPCDAGDPGSCTTDDEISYCLYGRTTQDSCLRICQEIGDDAGVTYDFGSCLMDATTADCSCCDVGEPGCDGGMGTSG
jgi:hypothetical protein